MFEKEKINKFKTNQFPNFHYEEKMITKSKPLKIDQL